jgi:hypothetical protein
VEVLFRKGREQLAGLGVVGPEADRRERFLPGVLRSPLFSQDDGEIQVGRRIGGIQSHGASQLVLCRVQPVRHAKDDAELRVRGRAARVGGRRAAEKSFCKLRRLKLNCEFTERRKILGGGVR